MGGNTYTGLGAYWSNNLGASWHHDARYARPRGNWSSQVKRRWSIAALVLTTEAVIADKPEKDSAPAMPGGGMDDF